MAYKRELIINNGSLTSYKKLLKVSDVYQLLNKREYADTITNNGVTFTNNGDGSFTANGTATARVVFVFKTGLTLPNGIFLLSGKNGLLSLATDIYIDGVYTNTRFADSIFVSNYSGDFNGNLYFVVEAGGTVNNLTSKPQLFDLTEMYGAGNEPATVAEFKAKFPNEMYDYSPRCWVKSYKTGLIAKTKNLFDWSGKLRQDYDTGNCTIVETLTNGAILQGNVGSEPGTASYGNGWFRPGAAYGYGTAVTLSANDVVTISADYEILERNYASPTTIGVYLYGTEQMSHPYASPIETGVLYRIKDTYTITKDGQYYPVFTLNSSKVKITNIQIEKGTTATDYVPYGYL